MIFASFSLLSGGAPAKLFPGLLSGDLEEQVSVESKRFAAGRVVEKPVRQTPEAPGRLPGGRWEEPIWAAGLTWGAFL